MRRLKQSNPEAKTAQLEVSLQPLMSPHVTCTIVAQRSPVEEEQNMHAHIWQLTKESFPCRGFVEGNVILTQDAFDPTVFGSPPQ